MHDKAKKAIQGIFRSLGFELRRYRTYIPPAERSITLEQFTSLNFGEILIDEARFLTDLVKNAPPEGPMLEIGTLFGWSTRIIAIAKPPQQPLITVDSFQWNPWELTPEEHKWITGRLLADAVAKLNVRQVVMDKNIYYAGYDKPAPALMFMDAGHSYEETRRDLEFAKRVGAKVICGHDYDPVAWPGVVQAVDEFGGPTSRIGSLWVL